MPIPLFLNNYCNTDFRFLYHQSHSQTQSDSMSRNRCFKVALLVVLSIVCSKSFSQSGFVMLGSKEYSVLDRLQIKLGKDSLFNFSAIKPYSRKQVVEQLEHVNQLAEEGKISLSKVDKYNIELCLKENFEYRKGYDSKDSTLNLGDVFTKKTLTHPAYIGVKRGDFSLYSTLHIDYTKGKDNNLSTRLYNNNRVISIRGFLNKNIGYYSYLFEHQEADPLYVNKFVKQFGAVPGEGFFNSFKQTGFDVFNARGGIMFKASKGIDVQFAFDKVFIGDGFRSLILSDFSNNFLFLKVNTRLWRFNYHQIFAELVQTHGPSGGSTFSSNYLYPKKYMAFHQLDIQASKRVTIGAFESVMFGRSNGFALSYLNPIIFYRAVERQEGSPDKVTIGLNVKANPFRKTQLYGQLIVNEFSIDQIKQYNKGSFVNKQAVQIGAKMIDFLGVKNLDIQAEANIVRPFVYSHYDTVGSFTHYNQPLAHPLGANFKEYIGILKYQPFNKLQLQAKIIYYKQGLDSAGYNFGGNIFNLYSRNRLRDNGFFIGSGILTTCLYTSLTATYEILPNLYFDANTVIRKFTKAGAADFNTNIYSFGMRLNIGRREFDF